MSTHAPSPLRPSSRRSSAHQPTLARPAAHPTRQRVVQWVRWFGAARLVVMTGASVLLVVGAVWVVHVPPPSTASTIPDDSGAVVSPDEPSPVPVVTLVGAPVTTAPTTLVVHVSGAVAEPGVHEVSAGSRVIAAVAAAGGARDDAHLDALNLAALLADGQRVYVPVEGELGDPYASSGLGADVGPPIPIDVNRATATDLERLPGVGPAIATAIVEDRERHGPFVTIDQLVRVRGIGPAKLDAIAPLVTL